MDNSADLDRSLRVVFERIMRWSIGGKSVFPVASIRKSAGRLGRKARSWC